MAPENAGAFPVRGSIGLDKPGTARFIVGDGPLIPENRV